MRNKKSLGKRLAALMLSILIVLSCSPVSTIVAIEAEYGLVEAPEAATISGNNTGDVQAEFTVLQWKDNGMRPDLTQSGWWVELSVYAPISMTTVAAFESAETSVTYQRLQGGGWSEPINFWQTQSSPMEIEDTSRYINFAEFVSVEMLESVPEGETLNFSWCFDWDMDGIYEQTVQAVLDPENVTLLQNAVQVYPSLGLVEPYTGGFVEGNGTSEVTVDVAAMSQQWSEANPEIGKMENGWGVGLRVIAPNNTADVVTVCMSEDAVEEQIPLNEDEFGAGYIDLWVMLTADMTEDINRNIRLDWDADGSYDQSIHLLVDVSELNLTLIEQPVFAFETLVPEDQWISDGSFTNVAVGGLDGQPVTYGLVTEAQEVVAETEVAAIDPMTGTLTFKTTGEVTVRATKAGTEGYAEAVAEYHLNIVKKLPDMAFATTGVVELVFEENLTFQNIASVAQIENSAITYYISSNGVLVSETEVAAIDEQTGELIIYQAGTVEVCARGQGNEAYFDAECTYTLQVQKAEQRINYVDPPVNVTYTTEAMQKLIVEGGVTGNVVFEILNEMAPDGTAADVAQINADGTITLLCAGSFTVQAVMTGDACYNDSEAIQTVIFVSKATQDAFAFSNQDEPFEVTYDEVNNTFINATVGELSRHPVEYAIVEGNTIAEVDENGVVTFDAAGSIVVQAKSPEDERYYEKAINYTLVVRRASQNPVFQDGVEVSKEYGILTYDNPLTYKGDGELTYSLSGDEIGVQLDSQTGRLSFNDSGSRVGEITVTATKKEDNRYLPFSVQYKLTVAYHPTPAEQCVLSGDQKDEKSGWYTGDVTIAAPTGYVISYSNKLHGNNWSPSVVHPNEGINTPVIYLKEANGYAITDAIEIKDVKVDKTDPQIESVRCDQTLWSDLKEQIFFSNKKVEVAVVSATDVSGSGEDVTPSGIATYMYSLTGVAPFTPLAVGAEGGSVAFEIEPQYRNTVAIYAIDTAGNTSLCVTQDVIVDNIAPNVAISYPGLPVATIEADEDEIVTRQDMLSLGENTRFVYTSPVALQIRVEESNFFEDDISLRVLYRPGKSVNENWSEVEFQQTEWVKEAETDIYTKDLVLGVAGGEASNGDYKVEMIYSDSSTNDMDWASSKYDKTGTEENVYKKTGVKTYTSNILSIDTLSPRVEVTYDNNEVLNGDCFKDQRVATYRITDRNFRPNEVKFTVTKAKNINGTPEEFTYSNLTEWIDWHRVNGGNTWEAKVTYDKDAVYEMTLEYEDVAGNKMETFADGFTVDQTAPNDLQIHYSENHANKMDIGNMVYRFFNDGENKPTTITLLATDVTSGVDYFELDVTLDNPREATDIQLPSNLILDDLGTDNPVIKGATGDLKNFVFKNYAAEDADKKPVPGQTVEVSFEVPCEFRGSFDFRAYDRAGNMSEYGDNSIVVVDSIEPTRSVTYRPTQIISESSLNVQSAFSEGEQIILFYNETATVDFTVTEANFYPEDITLFVNGAQAQFDGSWNDQGNVTWTNQLTFTNEGDYKITMEYMDRSKNTMVTYESPTLVIDRTAPVISVDYSYNNAENTLDDWKGNYRSYFSREQTVVVEIRERNFRADDVVVKVTAENRDGQGVMSLSPDGYVSYYAEEATQRQNWSSYNVGTWRRSDDTFVLNLLFSEDANYTFEIECKDMALNEAESPAPLYFTVDQTSPEQLDIRYSTSVLEEVLESITFGFYNAMMTVDISARDETAGIHQFTYSYINSPGVSTVNAELIDEVISEQEIEVSGSTAEASFTIPKYVLGDDNQFNGTVEFKVRDRSNNEAEKQDTKRIVVDNISPVAQVSYNAPVKQKDDISYYSGNVTATIDINEANFYATDVLVTVYKDSENYPVEVSWTDKDVDNHTGTFTLAEEGTYEVAISYVDKSENVMNDYRSNPLIIDKTRPSITVSNVRHNSANKDEIYGFEIELYDINMDEDTIKPTLTAVVSTGDGKYENVQMGLGDMRVLEEGKRFAFAVPNLTEDAVYTLLCSATDLAGNVNSEMLLEDGQQYQQVQFSINRNGSTFKYGTDYTEEVVGQYFIYNVEEPLVVEEINVDPIEEYSVILNGEELIPGDGFETEQTDNPNEWHKRTYVLNSELFEKEGEYRSIVASVDKAETQAYSDLKGLELSFVVDQTAPILTISGLEPGGRYRTQEQTVVVMPTDEGGKLHSLKAVVTMPNGNAIVNDQDEDVSVRFDMEGEALEAYLAENSGKVTFTVPEGLQRYVQIICRDCAFNASGTPNEYNEVFKNVTVSDNEVVIFYANKPLFYSVVSSVAVIIAVAVVLLKKKKAGKATVQ